MYLNIINALFNAYGQDNVILHTETPALNLCKTTISLKQLPNWNVVIWHQKEQQDYSIESENDSTTIYIMNKDYPQFDNNIDAKPLLINNPDSVEPIISMIDFVIHHRFKAYKSVANIDNDIFAQNRKNETVYAIRKWLNKHVFK